MDMEIVDGFLHCGDKYATRVRVSDIVGMQVDACSGMLGYNNLRILTRGGMVCGSDYTYCIENGAERWDKLVEKINAQKLAEREREKMVNTRMWSK